ncbi:hypothetical protein HYW83_01540 [Candidatus Peregrinibacteria bacterium]|nr:hypothetical protein [Candidatus Peregrinibacteria bacterium]
MKYAKKPISDILRSSNTVFTFKDISIIWGVTDKKAAIASVNYYVKTGGLHRIRRGIYAKDRNYDRFELATKIYTPSYISFETVLTKAGIIFQYYGQIFVASYLTREITADRETYIYKKIKDAILTNGVGIEHKGNYSIASPERAFLDTIYLYKDYHFDNYKSLNREKVFEMLPIYGGNTRMEKTVKNFYGA